ncbi:hypothetical protein Lepto7375DRAFT_4088 [Leptolyngbya sp. PCC 7375]|nr:hypothetical protein Lepto7375DRAFT_4088 [Leptolyngbya sp. PCC 7375]
MLLMIIRLSSEDGLLFVSQYCRVTDYWAWRAISELRLSQTGEVIALSLKLSQLFS